MGLPLPLEVQLAAVLPDSVQVHAYHISTPPIASTALFSALPGQPDEPTTCESHFLALASPQQGNEGQIFVFAIEVLVFSTSSLTTVFVSKADSTGFISRLNSPPASPSVPQTVTRIFLDYLLKPRLSHTKLILSLFARSQHSYLFPGSAENPDKHVLDDRQLIKWWCKLLDAVWRPYDLPTVAAHHQSYTITAHVVVPGCDKGETRAFFPASHSNDLTSAPRWLPGYPVQHMFANPDAPLRSLIPRLPDDPKSRFLQDLDGDFISPQGHWRTVKAIDQFWEMMSYRQECSAGRLVGFIWIVFCPRELVRREPPDTIPSSLSSDALNNDASITPQSSQTRQTNPNGPDMSPADIRRVPLHSPPPSSPTRGLPEDEKGLLEPESDQDRSHTVPSSSDPPCPKQEVNGDAKMVRLEAETEPLGLSRTPGQVVVSTVDYEMLIESLLELDFAGLKMAAQSTATWLEQVASKAGVSTFGSKLIGSRPSARPEAQTLNTMHQVNLLTGVKKKRKAGLEVDLVADTKSDAATPQTLSSSLVRKKPKAHNAGY